MKRITYILLSLLFVLMSCDSEKKDTKPPGVGTLEITQNVAFLTLTWVVPEDKDVKEVIISRGENSNVLSEIDTLLIDEVFDFQDANVNENTTYFYTVSFMDKSGNRGENSNVVSGEKISINPNLTAYAFDQSILITKQNVNQSFIDHYIVEKSSNNSSFETVNDNLSVGTSRVIIDGLTNNVLTYVRFRSVTSDGYTSEGTVISITPENKLLVAWNEFLVGNYDTSISIVNENISKNVNVNNSKAVRGWSYSYKSNGDPNSSFLLTAISDFKADISNEDNLSGLVFAYYLKNDFGNTVLYSDMIHSLDSYNHNNISDFTQRLIRIYGAYAYWSLFNYVKVIDYLDAIEPNITHNNDPEELLSHIDRLFEEETSNSKIAHFKLRNNQ